MRLITGFRTNRCLISGVVDLAQMSPLKGSTPPIWTLWICTARWSAPRPAATPSHRPHTDYVHALVRNFNLWPSIRVPLYIWHSIHTPLKILTLTCNFFWVRGIYLIFYLQYSLSSLLGPRKKTKLPMHRMKPCRSTPRPEQASAASSTSHCSPPDIGRP